MPRFPSDWWADWIDSVRSATLAFQSIPTNIQSALAPDANSTYTDTQAPSHEAGQPTEGKGFHSMRVPNSLLVDYLQRQGFEGITTQKITWLDALSMDTGRIRRLRAAFKRINAAWAEYAVTLPFDERFSAVYGEMNVTQGAVAFKRGGRANVLLPAAYPADDGVPFSEVEAAIRAAVTLPTWTEFGRVGGYMYFRATEGASAVHQRTMGSYEYGAYIYNGRSTADPKVDASDARSLYRHVVNTFVPNYRTQLRQAYQAEAQSRITPIDQLPRGQRNQKKFTAREKQERLEKYLDMRASTVTPVNLGEFVIPGHGTKSSRNWGIEVESAGARGVRAPAGWNRKYDGSLESAYTGQEEAEHPGDEPERPQGHDTLHLRQLHTHHPETGDCQNEPNPEYVPEENCSECDDFHQEHEEWQTAYDRYNYGDDNSTSDDCAEFVSPILHSFHSKGLEKIVTELSTQPQNDTAGIHVHVDAADLTPQQIGGLVYGYNMLEPLLEASYRRETREYCKPRPLADVFDLQRRLEGGEDPRQGYMGDRYVSLNLVSLSAHGTIEFRAMGPVYDYEYLIRWAYLCRELVNAAKNGATKRDYMQVKNFTGLKSLLIRFGNESVDNALSMITEADIVDMGVKNRRLVDAQQVFAGVGGEI